MKKIVAAFDGLKYSKSTRDYAIHLAQKSDTHLVGIFLDDFAYNSYKVYEVIIEKGVPDERLKKLAAKDKNTRALAAMDFEKSCQKAGLKFSIHHDPNVAIQELKHESIYADLLIINYKETLTHYSEKPPTRFVRDLLEDTQCPVLVVPSEYKPIKKLIFLYDGGPSSVYAIKMFSYLLPSLGDLETEVISVNAENTSFHVPDNKLMKEFMKRHFPKAKYIVKSGQAEDQIVKYLNQQNADTLVVLGAYRRGMVSRFFKESMADVLMKKLKLPLLIAHNK